MQASQAQAIETAIRQYITESILFSKTYPYSDDASLLENGVIDSMNVMELVLFLEENLGIQVEDHEIIPENFDSVSKLADFVKAKQAIAA
ncbi:phosphopantetheine-binding protein [Egbenema bharatensis]|uniref:phosphopantetheine-binding protein n=1 Tax=Egbenema bharatensis TaxID=3463334 RepID=UPI003A89B7C5